MLDKFRCDFIVHFYGAVFIKNKTCLVTEFAEYGSMNDLMKSRKGAKPIKKVLRYKILLDAARGIKYLHSNDILHRDIKPDNILVVSLDENNIVNGKLTDFGSARNVNMMMTNMTFTKGVGTPKYMSPEVLNREKYKKPADVYTFSITMYECIIWGDPFPKELYPHPWDIADNVMRGERPNTEHLSKDVQDLLSASWAQDPRQRAGIDEVVNKLEKLYNTVQ